ncbi:ABC transporter ATP-binding protein [Leucobacter sp. USHLN154]|uniref:ABC transporter ATP-binding protein n=1 Tax=Leucobacter sp. USHLN154 TaxID=3081269 RepID=UPI0030172475
MSGPHDSPAIETRSLTKHYGSRLALDGLNLRVERGSVFGFLGANGAGKTTAIRILLALARATSGSARLLDHAPGSTEVRPLIGYCPDVPGFPSWMTAREVLEQAATLFQLPQSTVRRRVPELLELTGLADTRARVGGYSRGMRQRLGLAQAFINSPQLLVLDEPTSALDPMGRRAVLELITELKGKTTVFFSTHLLPDVERVCDDVAILSNGRVAAEGALRDVRARLGGSRSRLVVETDEPERLREALRAATRVGAGSGWVLDVAEDAPGSRALVVTVDDVEDGAARVAAVVSSLSCRLFRLEPRAASLEDVFVDLVEGAR